MLELDPEKDLHAYRDRENGVVGGSVAFYGAPSPLPRAPLLFKESDVARAIKAYSYRTLGVRSV